jgi:hypothetical protein
MGVIVDKADCSICGHEYGTCDHERNQVYNGEICYKVPVKCSKGLHVALTNDPADGEAEIKNCIFQEMNIRNEYNSRKSKPGEEQITPNYAVNEITGRQEGKMQTQENKSNFQPKISQQSPNYNQKQQSWQSNPNQMQNNQMPDGMAGAGSLTGHPGSVLSPDMILKELAERIKTIEQKISNNALSQNQSNTGVLQNNAMSEGTPELLNVSPQDQLTQDNMGTTTQFEAQKKSSQSGDHEEKTMGKTDGQTSNEKVPVNPKAAEVQEVGMAVDPMAKVLELLQQILARLPGTGTETQDVGELENANKAKAKFVESDPNVMKGHMAPGEPAAGKDDEGNVKNKAGMNKPGSVDTADFKKEMADMQKELKALKSRLEIQDNGVPEFGGANNAQSEFADLNANQRSEKFGDFGKWDSIFHGQDSAAKFKR